MKEKLFIRYIKSLPKNAKILDAGCGKGTFLGYVRKIRKDLDFYGVDIQREGRKLIPEFIKYSVRDICDMEFVDNDFFDCILCFHVLEHISQPYIAIKELRRTLKKGGLIIAECPHWMNTICPVGPNFYDDSTHIRPYNEKSMKDLFKDFEILDSGSGNPHEVHSIQELQSTQSNIPLIILILGKIFRFYKCSVYIVGKKERGKKNEKQSMSL